jgi:hypothetical protein
MTEAPRTRAYSPKLVGRSAAVGEQAQDALDPADVFFEVAPDAARSEALLTAWAGSYADASRNVLAAGEHLLDTLASSGECSGTMRDYSPPQHVGEVRTPDGEDFESGWQGKVAITVEANLKGLGTVQARAARIDRCLGALHSLDRASTPAMKNVAASLGTLLVRVDRPEHYRVALVNAKTQRLAALDGQSVAQFHAEDTRCTSSGEVRIVRRNLSGIALDIDFSCGRVLPAGFHHVQ